MNIYYNQNYKREEVSAILKQIQDCIKNNHFLISQNEHREENRSFINEYNLSTKKQKQILLSIKVDDFCHSLKNKNPGYEHEVLYVFVPQVKLFNVDDIEETVDIYIKFNIIDRPDGNKVIVISFHKKNKDIEYVFR